MLEFFSGASSIPQGGFDITPSILFNNTTKYPMASTCALELTLPTCHESYDAFEVHVSYGFLNHGGFGLY